MRVHRADRRRIYDGFAALAHRGGPLLPASHGRENSMLAFTNAVELGYRCLETDVQATSDGVLVAFHDPTLDRSTDRRGRLDGQPWAQVRRARIGGQEPIPTLDEVLEAFDDSVIVNIDLKTDHATHLLAAAIRRHRAEQRVCVVSFDDHRLRRFRRLTGDSVATGCSRAAVAGLLTLPAARALRGFGGDVVQVPVTHKVAGVTVPVVTPRFIARAHALGRPVHVWTINDRAEMERLIDLGVDGLISDRIDVLREVLLERGLW